MAQDADTHALRRDRGDSLAERDDDPPVVARLVIEVRSDGTRTIARGAMEDVASGERVAMEARGGSPLELSASLAGSIVQTLAAIPRAVLSSGRGRFTPNRSKRTDHAARSTLGARLRRVAGRLLGRAPDEDDA